VIVRNPTPETEFVDRLAVLARNIWWSWHPLAWRLFAQLDPPVWEAVDHNPILLLQRIAPPRLAAAAADADLQAAYAEVFAEFAAGVETAIPSLPEDRATLLPGTSPVAYFSAEFGLHPSLPNYSGGLGVLAGDHAKEASDLALPLVGVSLLYRLGSLHQRLTPDGWQQDVAINLDPAASPIEQVTNPDGSPLLVRVALDQPERPVLLALWRVMVGRVPIYLLDPDFGGNLEWSATMPSLLYGGDQEHRLHQEIILGIGGVRALRALEIAPAVWHVNEGHAAFHLLERARELVVTGLTFEAAAEQVRATTVFTTHTPVPAGHDVFSPALMDRYFDHYWPQLRLSRDAFLALGRHDGSGKGFNMTALALRLAGHRNAVSERHGEVTRRMWQALWPDLAPDQAPITTVTNGVHLPTWISPPIAELLDRHLATAWRDRHDDPSIWEPVRTIPDSELWAAHLSNKRALLDRIRTRSRRRWIEGAVDIPPAVTAALLLDPNVLTIGFARRFATYKRATLLFREPDRLARLVTDPARPVQFVFSGKAHPADEGGKRFIQDICGHAQDPRYQGRIVFLEDYDLDLAAHLVAGVDAWLNTPRAPMEASGTSGMKAAVNGIPSLSILDGWWAEAWQPDGSNGWGIEPSTLSDDAGDSADAAALYALLETTVAPLYYARSEDGLSHHWIAVAKESIRTVAPRFGARRMLLEYTRRLYRPAAGLPD
jgi:starch phosphorylase